jgi:hypothetical protein
VSDPKDHFGGRYSLVLERVSNGAWIAGAGENDYGRISKRAGFVNYQEAEDWLAQEVREFFRANCNDAK